ncbi:hypothetical protein [Roseivirga misakiensis]|uniref:Uncharacterized protein n=1 Tax=Roseivirga misakiensis TaxID=1563681 RepID=A0A1E5SKS1_9BACT|nr:hypothetical protein [Roseivirga misakiensis]OEJ99693.1 hypothetical protein BFP71_08980 [Roseivirga misakiensis]
MSKSKAKRLIHFILRSMRIMMVAYMMGIANIVKQESRFMDDSLYKIEVVQEQEDDEPFEEL